jgi:hypothetical protein
MAKAGGESGRDFARFDLLTGQTGELRYIGMRHTESVSGNSS